MISAPETAQSAHDEENRPFRQRRSDPRHGPGSMSLLLSSLLAARCASEVMGEVEMQAGREQQDESPRVADGTEDS